MKKFLTQALESNNTIIIPGFGALTITSEKTREIYFIPYLKHDDGTLSNIISTYNSEDIDSSKNFIKEFVENINESLEKNSLYELNDFGRFKINKSGDIEFEKWEDYNKINEINKEKKQKVKNLKNKELNNKSEEELVNSKLDLETKNNDSILDNIISNSENNIEIFEQKTFKEKTNFDLNTNSNSLYKNDTNELDIKLENDNNLSDSNVNNIAISENSGITKNEIHNLPFNTIHEDFSINTEESNISNEDKEEIINDKENEITNQENEETKLNNIEQNIDYDNEKTVNSINKNEDVIIDNTEINIKNENIKSLNEDLNNNEDLINKEHKEEIDKIVAEKTLTNGSQKSKKKSIIPWIFVGLGISSGIVSYILYSRKNEIIILDENSSVNKISKNIEINKNKSKEKEKLSHNKKINKKVGNVNNDNTHNTVLLNSQNNNYDVDKIVNHLNTDKNNSSLINNLNSSKIQTATDLSTNSNVTNIKSSQNSSTTLSTQNNKPIQGKAGNKIELIAETFNDQSSAEKMVTNLKDGGYKNARIEKKDNQFNVIIDSYNTLSETVKELNKYRGK